MKHLIITISVILGVLSPALAEKAAIELVSYCETDTLPKRHTFLGVVSNEHFAMSAFGEFISAYQL